VLLASCWLLCSQEAERAPDVTVDPAGPAAIKLAAARLADLDLSPEEQQYCYEELPDLKDVPTPTHAQKYVFRILHLQLPHVYNCTCYKLLPALCLLSLYMHCLSERAACSWWCMFGSLWSCIYSVHLLWAPCLDMHCCWSAC
jgi:hypothetical protein